MMMCRWITSAVLIAGLFIGVMVHAEEEAETVSAITPGRPIPKHDAPDQLFRRAPMAAATRSIIIPLSTNVHLAFDAELLRTHVVWQGNGLNLFGPPYHGSSDRFICDFDGTVCWTTPQICPWRIDTTNNSSPIEARFKGIGTKSANGQTTLMYEIGIGEKSVRVHEIPALRAFGNSLAVARRFEIAPCEKDLFLLVHAENGAFLPQHSYVESMIQRTNDVLLVALHNSGQTSLIATNENLDRTEIFWLEKNGHGPAIERKTNHISGTEARIYVKIPAHSKEIAFAIHSVLFTNKADLPALEMMLNNGVFGLPNMATVTNQNKSPATPRFKEFSADKTFFPRLDGDKSYKVEHFPLPKEIDLRITGLDFLPDGDLAVCSWAGEVYFVHNAQSDARNAVYRRFARGLIEPMGIRIVDGRIYVVQKCELTRLTDTDGDGEADLFETINSGWGFTGRYNDFAFGPELDNAGNFYVFIGGNGGFWDVPYMGWAVKISPDGRNLEPFCSGLRVPNGFLNLNGHIFVTENQGNWIGACKLNHLQARKFFGYPSSWPAPKEKFEQTTNFTPPAIWFPYTLAKSASGIAVIPDDRLGPFKGQMIIGDFQMSVLTRVMLEKVNNEYQGAVWPFAKGFLSGINRVVVGPDGKVYVGGGKGAHWAGAVGPQLYSLDRLSFTGKTPFEIKEVHAKKDGFELTFTEPVDAAAAADTQNYDVAQYTYKYHSKYGSPEIDHDGKENSSSEVKVTKAAVSEDKLKVRLSLEGLRPGYVTMVRTLDTNENGDALRQNTFWYTLNNIPNE